ncbi:hypothetical protein EDB80DRAFT_836090 [Ilyonectria destructans]|nr:hypothetical protein EDB80DRAFT_836090 [Ilyonectria destructans]
MMMAASSVALCSDLSGLLPERVFTQHRPEYRKAIDSYNSLQERELEPSCVVFPTSAAEVAAIIKTLVKHNAKFAVTGGGCMPDSGAANIKNGVTISLRRMNQIAMKADETIVSVGGGATWGEVYEYLDPLGVAVPGGRVANVGVGGLTIGGGISYFSGRHGFVCDNVQNFEIVLASGEITNANKQENIDLWLALRGGSSNFGIVTRFDIRTFFQGKLFGGIVLSPLSTVNSQFEAFAKLGQNYDPHAVVLLVVSWNQATKGSAVITAVGYGKEDSDPSALKPLTDVQPRFQSSLRISTVGDLAKENMKMFKKGVRLHGATTTFRCDLSMIQTAHRIWEASIKAVATIHGIHWPFSIQLLPAAFSSHSAEQNANVLGLKPADGPLVIFMLDASWDKAEDDAAVIAAAKKLIVNMDAAAKETGMHHPFKYLNYAAYWQSPIASYGPEAVKHLWKTSKKYDLAGVFQTLCPGGFKLPIELSAGKL